MRQVSMVLVAALAVVLVLRWMIGGADLGELVGDDEGDAKLIVYCAHDAVYAEPILEAFEAETGIALSIKYDTEATKSLGLVELIARERENPRCDVFWNNEALGTSRLAEQALFEPYKGSGWQRIPNAFKDGDGRWVGFGARMRVWIVNTEHVEPTQDAIDALLAGDDLSRVAIAKPLFGTTRTHYTVLWRERGGEHVETWHDDWRRRGALELAGNGPVADAVANGVAHIGLTDTDDYFSRRDRDKPVAMVPFALDSGATIVIPNTAAIVKGSKQIDAAQRLVDYLASAATEARLARSASRQIPIGASTDISELPDDVAGLIPFIERAYPAQIEGDLRHDCLDWLRERYTK